MESLNYSLAALRVFGDSLDPDRVSQLLGGVPTTSFRKGEVKPSKIKNLIRKSGGWMLDATRQEPANLDAQIEEILCQLTQDLKVWAILSSEHKVDLYCGWFMEEIYNGFDGGFEISAKNLKALGERGIKFGICIYGPSKDLLPDDPCPCQSGKTYRECCGPEKTSKS